MVDSLAQTDALFTERAPDGMHEDWKPGFVTGVAFGALRFFRQRRYRRERVLRLAALGLEP